MAVSDDSQQRGVDWLTSLLTYTSLPATVSSSVHTGQEGEATCWLEIHADRLTAEQVQGVIGDRGRTLDAIQYLANSILNLAQDDDHQQPFIVELAGYRVQRQAELAEIAQTAAAEARETGSEVEIPGLSSAERRQVHTLLKDEAGLATFSRGKEPDRCLVIKLSDDPSDNHADSDETAES